jgi:hypothetical protein
VSDEEGCAIRISRLALLTTLALSALFSWAPSAGAGCASSYTKTISGTILGEDRRYVNALVGLDINDSSGRKIGMDGCALGSQYSIYFRMNPTLPATGSTSGGHLTWSVAHIPANAYATFIEVYPQNPQSHTDESRYGMSMRNAVKIGSTGVSLRLPLLCSLGGGTGGIQGYVTRNGQKVTPSRAIAWSQAADSNSYIMGMNIGSVSSGFYKLPNLAKNQRYVMRVTYNGVTQQRALVYVNACRWTPVNLSF